MTEVLRYAGQAVVYVLIALAIGYFANGPAYVHFPPDQALIKLSFGHGGEPKGECRRLTPEELAALAPNMRKPFDCPRERVPVVVALELDGQPLYQASLPPSGISGDGPSGVYERFPVAPGRHRLVARLRDTGRTEGFDYEREVDFELAPSHIFVVDFRAEAGGFVFK